MSDSGGLMSKREEPAAARMTLEQAQREAIRRDADSAEFDLVTRSGRSHCRFEDADMGVFRVLDRPAHLAGKAMFVSSLTGDDGYWVENFSVPAKGRGMAYEEPNELTQAYREVAALARERDELEAILRKLATSMLGQPNERFAGFAQIATREYAEWEAKRRPERR